MKSRVGDLRAATSDGIYARAHDLPAHAGHHHFSFDKPRSMTGRLLGQLLRDAAGISEALNLVA
jgi:hypothetical protein